MRSALRGVVLSLGIGAALVVPARTAEAQPKAPKIIVVDVRRAILDTEDGLRIQATLKRLFDVRQRELFELQRSFQNKQNALNQQVQAGTPQAQLQPQLQALQQLYVELNQKQGEYTNEMAGREQQLTGPIYVKIVGLARKLAAQQGADLVVDRTAVAYYKAELEVTDRVIQMYNSGESPSLPAGTTAPPVVTPPATKPAPAPKGP